MYLSRGFSIAQHAKGIYQTEEDIAVFDRVGFRDPKPVERGCGIAAGKRQPAPEPTVEDLMADLPITRPEPADVMRELEEILRLSRPDGEQEQRPPESGS